MNISEATALFKEKAARTAATVVEVKDLHEAMAYALDICEKKEACELLFAGCAEPLSPDGAAHCERVVGKVLAAPGLDTEAFTRLASEAEARGFTLLRQGLRGYLSGIDVGFTVADLGIAQTATCVLGTPGEDLRLCTMICEIHIVALAKSRIVTLLAQAGEQVDQLLSRGPMFVSFISGPSRTSDIERVPAFGVHGPLELHVALLEE